jgi:hypothetical protein
VVDSTRFRSSHRKVPFSHQVRSILSKRGWNPPSVLHHGLPQSDEEVRRAQSITDKIIALLQDPDFDLHRSAIMSFAETALLAGRITEDQYLLIYSNYDTRRHFPHRPISHHPPPTT